MSSIHTRPVSLPVGVHFQRWISTHTIYTIIYPATTAPLSRDPQVQETSVCVSVCVTVHACVTLCVGGCTCVFIKKYQLFWSVVHHSSHSPLACAHLAWPQEKKRGKVCDRRRSDWARQRRISKSRREEEEAEEEEGVFFIKGYGNMWDFWEYLVNQSIMNHPKMLMSLHIDTQNLM